MTKKSDAPAIRFKGFSDAWEQRKFGDLVEKYEDPVVTPTEGYTRLGIRSHAKGTFHSYVEKGKDEELLNKYRKQLDLYKRALESALNRKVDKVYIYSVYLEKEIEYI